MRFLLIIVAVILTLPGCSMLVAESQKRNDLWEQYTAEAVSAHRRSKLYDAEAKYRAAIDVAKKFHATDPRRYNTMISLADVLREQGKYEEAENLYSEAISWFETWSRTAKTDEVLNRGGKVIADGYYGLGCLAEHRKDLVRAKDMYEKSRKITLAKYGAVRSYQDATEALARIADAQGDAATAAKLRAGTSDAILSQMGRPKFGKPIDPSKRAQREAEEEKHHYKRWQDESTKYGANSGRAVSAALNLMRHYKDQDKYTEALKLGDRYLNDASFRDKHFKAMVLNQQADTLEKTGDSKGSLVAGREALALATDLNEVEEIAAAKTHIGLALKDDPKMRGEAIKNLRDAWDVQRNYNIESIFWNTSLALGELYMEEKRYGDAQVVLKESVLAQGPRENHMMRLTLEAASMAYRLGGKTKEADEFAARAEQIGKH